MKCERNELVYNFCFFARRLASQRALFDIVSPIPCVGVGTGVNADHNQIRQP